MGRQDRSVAGIRSLRWQPMLRCAASNGARADVPAGRRTRCASAVAPRTRWCSPTSRCRAGTPRCAREGDGWFVDDLGVDQRRAGQRVAGQAIAAQAPATRCKVGIFELTVEGEADERRPCAPRRRRAARRQPTRSHDTELSSATIVRSLADFNADYGLGEPARAWRRHRDAGSDKRKALDQAYESKIFGFLTRLARLLMTSPTSVDEVLARVMDDRLRGAAGRPRFHPLARREDRRDRAASWRAARIASSTDPKSEVPVSKTMLDTVMTRPRRAAHLRCAVRPATGRRRVDPHPPDPRRDVRAAVVGRAHHRRHPGRLAVPRRHLHREGPRPADRARQLRGGGDRPASRYARGGEQTSARCAAGSSATTRRR